MHLLTSTAHAARIVGSVLIVGFLAIGLAACDSGGGNGGDPLDGDLTFRVEGGETGTAIAVSKSFFYDTGDGVCQSSSATTGNVVPAEGELSPDDAGTCDVDDPSNFDGVRVTVSPQIGSADLTLQLLSDGDVVDEATEPESFGGGEAWVVEAGEIPDLTQ